MPGVVSCGGDEGTIISFKIVGKRKGEFSDFSEEQRLFGSKVYCVMIKEVDVLWDLEKGA